MNVPEHIAIIMDGNGRWAKEQGKPRAFGHAAGAETIKKMCIHINNIGVKYLTIYAFSTENWKRSQEEVGFLMTVIRKYLKMCQELAMENGIRVRIIGGRKELPKKMLDTVQEIENATSSNAGMLLQIALNYGGRDEIVRAVRKAARDISNGKIEPDKLDEAAFETYLDTFGATSPDLLIRTGGDMRISNFLLWQTAYSELYFSNVYWPDFDEAELEKAIEQFNGRERRYGGVKS